MTTLTGRQTLEFSSKKYSRVVLNNSLDGFNKTIDHSRKIKRGNIKGNSRYLKNLKSSHADKIKKNTFKSFFVISRRGAIKTSNKDGESRLINYQPIMIVKRV